MISIIVPIYNGASYINRCFASIFSQSETNYEVVAIDDGSTDESLSILKAYESTKIRVIHTENYGVCHARNVGLDNAKGEYIVFVDVDDALRSDALAILLHLIKKHDAEIVAGSKIVLDCNGDIKRSRVDKTEEEIWEGIIPLQRHVEDHISGHSVYSKLYKRELIQNIRFEEGKKVNEDSFFSFQCFAKAKKMIFLDVGIYKYYETPGSASRSPFSDKFFDIIYFAERKAEIIHGDFPQLEKYIPAVLARAYISLLFNMCKTYDKKYKVVEKQCLKKIKMLSKQYLPVLPHEKRILKIIRANLFSLYKCYLYLRCYRSQMRLK